MKELEIPLPKFPAPLKAYVEKLRATGCASMDFEMDEDFRKKFAIEASKITFKTHTELDEFVNGLTKKDPDFQYNYK